MNTATRSNLSIFIILGLVAISTLILAISLTSLRTGPVSYSAPVLFNQGNVAAQHGKVGEAIINYERAQLLAPNDPAIVANLQWVRDHAGLTAASGSWLDRTASWASPNTMALLGWMGLVLMGAGFFSANSFSQFRFGSRLGAFTGIWLLSLSALDAIAAWQKYHEAVVISPDVPARISPVTNGETSFKLRAGELVSIQGRYNDFTLVQNSTGHVGWVAQSDIISIIPQS